MTIDDSFLDVCPDRHRPRPLRSKQLLHLAFGDVERDVDRVDLGDRRHGQGGVGLHKAAHVHLDFTNASRHRSCYVRESNGHPRAGRRGLGNANALRWTIASQYQLPLGTFLGIAALLVVYFGPTMMRQWSQLFA